MKNLMKRCYSLFHPKREFMRDLQEKSLTSSARSAKEKTCELPDSTVISTGAERALCPEVLFLPGLTGKRASTFASGGSSCGWGHYYRKSNL